MLRRIAHVALCPAVVLCILSADAAAQKCDATIISSPVDSFAFLKAEQDRRDNPECITFAIYGVRGRKDEATIDLLFKYLDFHRPTTERDRVISSHLISAGDSYPAIDSLCLVGKSALPALAHIIASDKSTELSRQNALAAFMEIYRNDQPAGIERLKKEALKGNASEYGNLLNAAKEAVSLCYENNKEACASK